MCCHESITRNISNPVVVVICFHVFPSNFSEHVVAEEAVVGAVEAEVEVEKKEVK